jgi:hypothetical protein
MPSKDRRFKSVVGKVFTAVEGNSGLLDLLEIAISTGRKTAFIEALVQILPTAFARYNKQPEELFNLFTSWFGDNSNFSTDFSRIYAALQHRQRYLLDNRFQKRQFISSIGLDWTADAKSSFFSKVNPLCDVVKNFSFLS